MQEIPVEPSRKKISYLRKLRPTSKVVLPFFVGISVTLLGLLLFTKFFPAQPPLTIQQVNDTVAQAMASATPPPAYSDIVYQVIQPSLVLIQVKAPDSTGKVQDGLGSGVIVDDTGSILTALHVVAGATEIKVTFADGTQASGQVTTTQPENDIAVVHANKLPAQVVPAVLGNPNSVRVGDDAYVVGNPLGLYASMSAGVISGLHRTFQPPDNGQELKNMIQIDAAVNPGNSGGPLLNRSGQVVGIITGIVNPTGQDVFIGIGFAVPIDIAGGALGSPVD